MFCVRVMVGVIILYDHVHPVGAFAKTSPIDVSIHYHRTDIIQGAKDSLMLGFHFTLQHPILLHSADFEAFLKFCNV